MDINPSRLKRVRKVGLLSALVLRLVSEKLTRKDTAGG